MRSLPLALATAALALLAQAAALPAIQITKIYYDSPGVGPRRQHLGQRRIRRVKNTTRKAIELTGWTLRDPNFRYTFGNVTLGAGKKQE